MPSPSKAALFSGLLITAGIFVGGAYAATYLAEPATPGQQDGSALYMPSLVPAPTTDYAPAKVRQDVTPRQKLAVQKPAKVAEAPSSPAVEPAQRPVTAKPVPVPAAKKGLTVSVSGVRNQQGNVYVFVFADKAAYDAYDYTRAVGYMEVPATTNIIQKNFPELDGGPYAVGVFHDQNGDQDFNMDSNGYPVEGYGTSNARGKYDQLSFEQALVQPGEVPVKMHYLQ